MVSVGRGLRRSAEREAGAFMRASIHIPPRIWRRSNYDGDL